MRAGSFALVLAVLVTVTGANAQITVGNKNNFGSPFHGVPPSVTSFNFGGQRGFHGVPASVTSLGFGNPGFRLNEPFRANRGFGFRHRRRFGSSRSPFFGDIVAVPYAYPVYVMEPGIDDSMEQEDYRGGPTIFDRRGSGEEYYRPRARDEEDYRRSPEQDDRRSAESDSVKEQPRAEQPVEAQPPTVLVFKDGHQSQVLNYAVVGDNLYELSNGRSIKIALAELDVPATQKENDQRGVDFKVPAAKAN
jgi:hypothetical protein